jgi:hypothetical protein
MTPATSGSEPWMPNGFPPPSFVVETERASAFGGARGRWLAAAAILGALLLIAGVLLLAGQDDPETDLTAGTTTTAFAGTTPTTPLTTPLDPTASLPPPANTVPVDPNVVVPGATVTTAGATATTSGVTTPAASGVLSVASTLAIPKVIGNTTGSAQMALKNNGNASLSFNSQTNFSGLTVGPATGNIGAGAEVVVTISLNGATAAEGPFSGAVSFGGSGGTQRVTVTSSVGRNPTIAENADAVRQCQTEGPTCSRLIDAVGEVLTTNPCNSDDWVYKVNVSDESRLKSVQAVVVNGTGADLKTGNPAATTGPSGVWQSDKQKKLPAGEHKFSIRATDTFDNVTSTTERTLTCPAAPAQ